MIDLSLKFAFNHCCGLFERLVCIAFDNGLLVAEIGSVRMNPGRAWSHGIHGGCQDGERLIIHLDCFNRSQGLFKSFGSNHCHCISQELDFFAADDRPVCDYVFETIRSLDVPCCHDAGDTRHILRL